MLWDLLYGQTTVLLYPGTDAIEIAIYETNIRTGSQNFLVYFSSL